MNLINKLKTLEKTGGAIKRNM